MSKETFMVIDGNSLAHRAFHAIPLLSTSQGVVTNAVYGFANMLFRILNEKKPSMVAVCFDKGKVTFRHDEYKDYKGTRKATPDELRPQFPLIKEFLELMGIRVLECENYEADDLIGTLVKRAQYEGIESTVLTGDRDVLQLVSPLTTILLTKKGISELALYREDTVRDQYGLTPSQLIDLKGLTGDTSDNIPGVPGIGEKTGVKLIGDYGSLENLLDHKEELAPAVREKLSLFGEQALMSKRLATIETGAPVSLNPRDCAFGGPDYIRLLPFLSRMEFKSLVKSISDKIRKEGAAGEPAPGNAEVARGLKTYQVGYTSPESPEEMEALLTGAAGMEIGLALSGNRQAGPDAAAVTLPDGRSFFLKNIPAIAALMENDLVKKVCFDAKSDMWLLKARGIELRGLSFDISVAAYLLNPGNPNRDLSDLALEHLQVVIPPYGETGLCARADVSRKLKDLLEGQVYAVDMGKLYYEVELPLVRVLAGMEMTGIRTDPVLLGEISDDLSGRIDALAAIICQLAGEQFNINSPRQLGLILFEKLQLPVIKKTKTGYSTDAGVLEELSGTHEIISHIILYRQLTKLKTTYIDGLAPLIDRKTGLVHTTFNQNVTSTGRLSSTEPNLQNIPIRLEEGRRIRRIFLPGKEGNLILAADYSQIELRILAHMSKDPVFLESFRKGQDIHTRTAAEVFGIEIDRVTDEMRSRAKAVNFGIIYGISDFGLARDIGVSRQEAGRYIKNYFERYKKAREFIDMTIAGARERGYVTTILNRRRYLPDLFSPNKTIRSFGERTAINTPIQGSAADIIKLAMVLIWQELNKRGLQTRMLLQVHDELIFETPPAELDEVKKLVRNCMENVIELEVPLKVDMKLGPNWYDVKKIPDGD